MRINNNVIKNQNKEDSSCEEAVPASPHRNSTTRPAVLTADEELQLMQQYFGNIEKERIAIYEFGFVIDDHIKIIDSLSENMDEIENVFITSIKNRSEDSVEHIFSDLKSWKNDIVKAKESIQSHTKNRETKKIAADRKRMADILLRHKVVSEKLEEWHSVAKEFLNIQINMAEDNAIGKEYLMEKILMPKNEFIAHMNDIKQYRKLAQEARDKIVESNLGLVINIAKKTNTRTVPLPDLIQEGNIGLMTAVDKFDYTKGFRLSTYATWWIRLYIKKAIEKQGRVIRIPMHMLEIINKMFFKEQIFIRENGYSPSNAELSKIMELTVEKISSLKKMAMQPLSLQTPLTALEDDDTTLEDVIESSTSNPFTQTLVSSEREIFKKTFETLTEQEQLIIKMRYEDNPHKPRTLQDVGNYLGLSKERVRQIESRIIQKMRRILLKSQIIGHQNRKTAD